ncbi:MAG TPA: ATP-binding protein [Acidimicrobiales bacterium]|jgi:PAS domain S-box-containing protein|nr:ATP-binding protein [Acidimicrobiales bacterium]
MTDVNPGRIGMTSTEVALLGEREALARLELLATVSGLLESALDDYDEAIDSVAEACVADFADMCVIESIGVDGRVSVVSYRAARQHDLELPTIWSPVGRQVAPDRRPVLSFRRPGNDSHQSLAARQTMERLDAQSLMVVPVTAGGVIVGWLVAAAGGHRRGFRPSALRVATEIAGRIGLTVHSVLLRREMQGASREQARTVRRLRRLAAAATNLAGAATPQAVLETACQEACAIHEARGAAARWAKADGTAVAAEAGVVDLSVLERAFEAVTSGRVDRGPGWIAYPLPNTDPWQHAGLVVFVAGDLTGDEEPVLSSLASLIPVAFERALGTETAVKHEVRLRAVLDTSPVALIELGTDGAITSVNKRGQDLLGWTADPTTWLPPEALRRVMGDVAHRVLESGDMVTRTATYEGLEVSLSGARLPPVYAGETDTVLVAGVDLTEIRRAERALIQAQRLDAMGQVAGRVAHDFNNLLTLIIGYASILRRGISDERQLDMIANIEAASKRAATLTQQMLDMTRQRVDTGVVIDLGSAVSGLDAVLARVAGPKVELQIRASRNVIKVRLDPSEMEQIVVNLVINACDAMNSEGRIDVSVQVAAPPPDEVRRHSLPSGPLALLTVRDDGPGMPADVLARCMEPFFTTKERGHGTGLGLPTVYGLVQERGGQMIIDSEVGVGTTIRIWLPLERDAIVTAASDDTETWPAGRRVSGRVALIEDEADLKEMAVDALRSIGLEVVSFSSAEEAKVDLLPDALAGFDAVVTDVILPHQSGIELVAELRRQDRWLPVVFMTGYTGARDNPPDQGDPVVLKPYTPDQLRVRVAEVVSLGRIRARNGSPPPGP